MAKGSRVGRNFDEEDLPDFSISDEELERLMERGPKGRASLRDRAQADSGRLRSGSRVKGTVIDNRGEEILVELDAKTHGVIPREEFGEDPVPAVGSPIEATFVRFDPEQGLALLSVTEVRKEVFWDEISVGTTLEAFVIGSNKGGLVLKVKNVEAFMPISQIDLARVEDPKRFVGKKLECEVISVDRANEKLVVSRRALLERRERERKQKILKELIEGQVVVGTVTRITDFGAFVDVGGVEGLLHQQKIIRELGKDKPLEVGQKLEVEIARIDREKARIALDIADPAATRLRLEIEKGPQVGDVLVGWVRDLTAQGAIVAFEEGGEGIITEPKEYKNLKEGEVVKVMVLRRDPRTGRAQLKLA